MIITKTVVISLYGRNRSVFLVGTEFGLCEVGTECTLAYSMCVLYVYVRSKVKIVFVLTIKDIRKKRDLYPSL